MPDGDFGECYAAALRHYLSDGEASLAIGHDLGRRALRERLSMMEIVEGHFRVVEEAAADSGSEVAHATALQFLLQALATFDIATRGFLDGTKRYQQQRARADDLEDRDAFRSALVNSLQEGFFVVDHEGTVVEVNEAFAAITGCGLEDLPYRWPYPWLVDETEVQHQLARGQPRVRDADQAPRRPHLVGLGEHQLGHRGGR
jgi:PAS domain-containing protein